MIVSIPESWRYNDSLEMLYYFYQVSDELLSEVTPDTYSLPLHSTFSLLGEIGEIYDILEKFDIVETYYYSYIPLIIDEFLDSLEKDYLLKQQLGHRLFTIRTGFEEAKKNHVLLHRWFSFFYQACSREKYRDLYSQEIIRLVEQTKDKNKLLYCAKNYYVSLICEGYSREYLYISAKRFFDNNSSIIKDKKQIQNYILSFQCKPKDMDFLLLMDLDAVEYLGSMRKDLPIRKHISLVDSAEERRKLCSDLVVSELFRAYDQKIHSTNNKHRKISVVKYQTSEIDEYRAIEAFESHIHFFQAFNRYFKHYNLPKQIYKVLIRDESGKYREIKIPSQLKKRPYVEQSVIDSRIKNILQMKALSYSAFDSLAKAIQMHSEAIDSKNMSTLLRNFWTALETLFSNPVSKKQRENVINSVLPIIQKTYILKLLRSVYTQLLLSVDTTDLRSLGINSFVSFVEYFSSYGEASEEMKRIYSFLQENLLLRSRIYTLRKELSTGNNISAFLDAHEKKIEWQLKRLYRARNIATHVGEELTYLEIVINHLHNYFDFCVNYVLCKSENGDYISSISTLVFEAQIDNKIHKEMLKTDQSLSKDNYKAFLFGPDQNLINYAFDA